MRAATVIAALAVLQRLALAPVPRCLPHHPQDHASLDEVFLGHGKSLFDPQAAPAHEPDAQSRATDYAHGLGVDPAVGNELDLLIGRKDKIGVQVFGPWSASLPALTASGADND